MKEAITFPTSVLVSLIHHLAGKLRQNILMYSVQKPCSDNEIQEIEGIRLIVPAIGLSPYRIYLL